MHDYKHTARSERNPDAIVGYVVAVSAAAFFVMLWMGAV